MSYSITLTMRQTGFHISHMDLLDGNFHQIARKVFLLLYFLMIYLSFFLPRPLSVACKYKILVLLEVLPEAYFWTTHPWQLPTISNLSTDPSAGRGTIIGRRPQSNNHGLPHRQQPSYGRGYRGSLGHPDQERVPYNLGDAKIRYRPEQDASQPAPPQQGHGVFAQPPPPPYSSNRGQKYDGQGQNLAGGCQSYSYRNNLSWSML